MIGAGDAGIENALGLAADPEQRNVVTIVNRSAEFATAKDANVKALTDRRGRGADHHPARDHRQQDREGLDHLRHPRRRTEGRLRPGHRPDGLGAAAHLRRGLLRDFEEKDGKKAIVAGTGVQFSSPDRISYPMLSPTFESTVPGIYVIGALAGYPLIKHCMNQGYDVIEFINGNTELKPADEPILEKKFATLPGRRSVEEWLAFLRRRVSILNEMSMLQMREFMLDSDPVSYRAGDVIFERNEPGSSLFAIADGSVRGRGRSGQSRDHRRRSRRARSSARSASSRAASAAPPCAPPRARSSSRFRATRR